MRRFLSGVITLILVACSTSLAQDAPDETEVSQPGRSARVNLKNFGPALELENEVWLNTDHPLRLADLRGRVVLLDMWTFG